MPMPDLAYKPFEEGFNTLNKATNTIQNAISPESRDRASARLRASLDTTNRANESAIMDKQAQAGTAWSGRASDALDKNKQAYYSAYGQGMGEIENNFTNAQLSAGNAMAGIGSQQGALGQGFANARNNAMNTYLQLGNVLKDPTGAAAQGQWGQLGLDVSGMGFFEGPGQVNSIGGGTTINNGTGSGSGASSYLNPDNTINPQRYTTSMLSNFTPSKPIYYNPQEIAKTALGQQVLEILKNSGYQLVTTSRVGESGWFNQNAT